MYFKVVWNVSMYLDKHIDESEGNYRRQFLVLAVTEHFFTLLKNVLLYSARPRKLYDWLLAVTDAENVALSRGEFLSPSILKVDNVEGSRVHLLTKNDSNTTSVSSLGDHRHVANVELDDIDDLVLLDVKLHSVVDLNFWVRVADGASIVGHNVRDGSSLPLLSGVAADHALGTLGLFDNLKELELGVSCVDLLEDEASLDIVEKTELFVGLSNGDDIHEASRIVRVSADLHVDLDKTTHDNHGHFAAGESVLETVAKNEAERKALTQFVRTRARAGSPFSAKLVKHPVLGGSKPLEVLLRSASHAV